MKYAHHYKKLDFNVASICADTFRFGAFDQLEQNCLRIKVPLYGFSDLDPCDLEYNSKSSPSLNKGLNCVPDSAERSNFVPEDIVLQGINKFIKDKFDLILIDTAGRHRQADDLKEEMIRIMKVAKPNHTIMIMDGSIGKEAKELTLFFKQFGVDSIILTKMDNSNIKGGGALVAVASANSPVRFIGTGEGENEYFKII